VLGIALPALIVSSIWSLFRRINGAAPGEEAILIDAFERILHGELHPLAVYQILRFTGYLVIKTRVYGILIPLVIGLTLPLAAFNPQIRRDRLSMTVLVSGLLAGAGVIFMYYLTSYDQIMGLDLQTWLGTGYDRMLFGPVILLAAAGTLILWKVLGIPGRK